MGGVALLLLVLLLVSSAPSGSTMERRLRAGDEDGDTPLCSFLGSIPPFAGG